MTIPRTYTDYIVTEYGVARLRGKSIRDRVRELVNIAHPDVWGELLFKAIKRMYIL